METNSEKKKLLQSLVGVAVMLIGLLVLDLMSQCDKADRDMCLKRVRIHDTIYVDGPVVEKEVYVPVPGRVDTVEVVRDYYMERVYHDTIKVNDYVTLMVKDTVYKNKLQSAKYDLLTDFSTFSPTPIQANDKHNALSLGLDAGYEHLSLRAGYEWGKMGIEGGYDFINKAPVVGVKLNVLQW